jgi:hypothetical protein
MQCDASVQHIVHWVVLGWHMRRQSHCELGSAANNGSGRGTLCVGEGPAVDGARRVLIAYMAVVYTRGELEDHPW